jgi:hypothetical protein
MLMRNRRGDAWRLATKAWRLSNDARLRRELLGLIPFGLRRGLRGLLPS